MEEVNEMWLTRFILLILFGWGFFYYRALGRNVYEEETKEKRDMSHELNPFTGEKMPDKDDKNE